MVRIRLLFGRLLATALLGLLIWNNGNPGAAALSATTGPTAFVNKEIIRNGSFDWGMTNWTRAVPPSLSRPLDQQDNWTVRVVALGQDSNPVLWLSPYNDAESQARVYSFSPIHWPDQVDNATLSFRFGLAQDQAESSFGEFNVYFQTFAPDGTGKIVLPMLTISDTAKVDGKWYDAVHTLTADERQTLNTAHANGETIAIVIDLTADYVNVAVDDVSLKVTGQMNVHEGLAGAIAYLRYGDDGKPRGIKRVTPQSGEDRWVFPNNSAINILDLAWHPDASEIAFSGTFQSVASAYQSDVYAIQPDGTGFRRITNPPSPTELKNGSYATGTVKGQLTNDTKIAPTTMLMYIRGAEDAISIPILQEDESHDFVYPNVADLGDGVQQYIVLTWSNLNTGCVGGKDYMATGVDVEAGKTVDIGEIIFDGGCNFSEVYDLSWHRDGSRIGFGLAQGKAGFGSTKAYEVLARGDLFGTKLISNTESLADLAWSPVDDELVYVDKSLVNESAIYRTVANGGPGTKLVDLTHVAEADREENLAWMPDGSAFIFNHNDYANSTNNGGTLNAYTMASGTTRKLANFYFEYPRHAAVSPDGRYLVFERLVTQISPARRELWLMDLQQPNRMWPLFSDEDGKNGNPDWSWFVPPTPPPAGTPTDAIYLPAVRR